MMAAPAANADHVNNDKTNPNYYDRDIVRWELSVSPAGQAKTR
jgi:hypothetical protein